jgi:hypothetical protein
MTDEISDLGKQAADSAGAFGISAGRKLDDVRKDTGDALHATASTVRSTARKSSAAIDDLAKSAADGLDATATYVEDHELKDVYAGVRRFARQHLAGSVVTAAALGFLAGSALIRATHSCGSAASQRR